MKLIHFLLLLPFLDIVYITVKDQSGWWQGVCEKSGKRGWIPKTFTEHVGKNYPAAQPLSNSQSASSSNTRPLQRTVASDSMDDLSKLPRDVATDDDAFKVSPSRDGFEEKVRHSFQSFSNLKTDFLTFTILATAELEE